MLTGVLVLPGPTLLQGIAYLLAERDVDVERVSQ